MSRCDECPGIAGYIVLVLGMLVVLFFAWMSGYGNGRNATYLEAVKEGHAEWVPHKETGKPQIEWKKK